MAESTRPEFYTQNVWNRSVKVECTKSSKETKGNKQPSCSWAGSEGCMAGNDVKNVRRAHFVDDTTSHVVKQKHWG